MFRLNIMAFREAVVRDLAAQFKGIEVAGHPGSFSIEEARRIARPCPQIRVAALGFQESERRNLAGTVDLEAAVFATDTAAGEHDADTRCLVMVDCLLQHQQAGGVQAFGQPQQIRAINHFSAKQAREGVCLWAVTWAQEITGEPLTDQLADFQTLFTTYDLGPSPDGEPEASDSTELPQ